MAAGRLVDRAGVQTRPAADAGQRFGVAGGVDVTAPVVDQDHVDVLRTVVVRAARPVDHLRVDGHRLAGRAARQNLRESGVILDGGDHLLDADQRYVHARQGRHHAPVALVGHQAQRAGLGDDEVAARNAHVRFQKGAAQVAARELRHGFGVVGGRHVQLAHEQVADGLFRLVDDRRDDMARRLVGKLHDELAQVGFQHVDVVRLQRVVERDFLADHALALDGAPDVVPRRDIQHQPPHLVAVRGPQHLDAVGGHGRFGLLEQGGQIAQGAPPRLGGLLAQGFAVGAAGPEHGHQPFFGGGVGRAFDGGSQRRIAEGGLRRRDEIARFNVHRSPPPAALRPARRRCGGRAWACRAGPARR